MKSKLQVIFDCVAGGFKQIPLFTFEIGRTKRNRLSHPLQGRKSPPKPAGGLLCPDGEGGGSSSMVTPTAGRQHRSLAWRSAGHLTSVLSYMDRSCDCLASSEHGNWPLKRNIPRRRYSLAFWLRSSVMWGLPGWLGGEESARHYTRCGFDLWFEKIPWGGKWQPPPVFLPEKFHGQRMLVGYSPGGCKESDTTA